MERCIERGSQAIIDNQDYLAAFGLSTQRSCSAGVLWNHIATRFVQAGHSLSEPVRIALSQGTLAERILRSLGSSPDHQRIVAVYSNLASCLRSGSSFVG
jgi:hypothetical protein